MDKHIAEYLAHILPLLAQRGIHIDAEAAIPYGWQLRLSRGRETAVLNVYHSAKKGVSTVIGGKQESGLHQELSALLHKQSQAPAKATMHTWQSWIGSDECGKGDFFGPLVVVAFAADTAMLTRLKELGVRDSKAMRDDEITTVAHAIYAEYPSRAKCIIIKPERYNQLIADFKSKGKTLNDLLAWQHSSAILDLRASIPEVNGALVDQFSPSKKVAAGIKTKEPSFNVIERHGAEADPAVAAASILARYQFVQAMRQLSGYFGMELPKGAGARVDTAARKFVERYTEKRLGEVAKLHFKNTAKVKQLLIKGI